jgi:hypothetical protein
VNQDEQRPVAPKPEQKPEPESQGSEVARLLGIIDTEYKSAWQGFYGLAQGTAQHDFITKRMEGIEAAREQLVTLMGDEDTANTMVIDQLNKAAQQEPEESKGKGDDS